MIRYIAKRLVTMIFVMLGVVIFVFAISRVSGDPVIMMLGEGSYTQEQYDAVAHEMGMDRPIIVQFFDYIWDVLHLDFGISYRTKEPVIDAIAMRLPISLIIALAALIISVPLGILIGIVCAVKQNTIIDYSLTALSLLTFSFPNFWLGLLFMLFFAMLLGIVPAGFAPGKIGSYFLPVLTMAVHPITHNARLTRTRMLEVIRQDYIRTARSKGLNEKQVIYKHALKNSIVPVFTQIGSNVATMVGGAAVVEGIFNVPGLGTYIVTAIGNKDFPALQSGILMFSLFVCIVNMIIDICYGFADPRIMAKYTAHGKKKAKTTKVTGEGAKA